MMSAELATCRPTFLSDHPPSGLYDCSETTRKKRDHDDPENLYS